MVTMSRNQVGLSTRAWRARASGIGNAWASGAGTALRVALAGVLAVRGLAALVLLSYGAWLAYEPAGWMVAGALLLADRLADARGEPQAKAVDE